MKKTVAALAIAAVASAACSRGGSEERAFEWITELPAGTVVHLRNGAGSIDVKRASGQTAQVSASKHWRRGRSRDINFVVTQNGNDYYICAMWRNSGKCGASGYRGRNTGGFLAMFSLFNRHSDASADFEAELPANVVIDAKNTSGEVNIDGITGGVTAQTINGDVKATNVAGKVKLQTTNGDLVFSPDASATPDALSMNTTNGEIRAELPPGSEGNFDISTVNGDVRSSLPLANESKSPVGQHLRGQIGSLQRSVKLRSVNGSVVVTTKGTVDHQ
ncbi:MAG TPA: DUF4097 family beta strand repeat-containing protein [Gemmatimonadaceae bacterium]